MQFISGQNIFVIPSNNRQSKNAEEDAILKLANILRLHTKQAVKAFHQNYRNKMKVIKYFNKMCTNYEFSRKIAFLKFKLIPNRGISNKIAVKYRMKQLKLLWKIIGKKYHSRTQFSMSCLKLLSWNIKYKK